MDHQIEKAPVLWEARESTALKDVWAVHRKLPGGRSVAVYDNWSSLNKAQAQAIAAALNSLDTNVPVSPAVPEKDSVISQDR